VWFTLLTPLEDPDDRPSRTPQPWAARGLVTEA
jgi:hypothetical protein